MNNLRHIKEVRVRLWKESGNGQTFRSGYWRFQLSIYPEKGEMIGAERVLDPDQLERSVSPEYVIDYAFKLMKDTVLKILRTGRVE